MNKPNPIPDSGPAFAPGKRSNPISKPKAEEELPAVIPVRSRRKAGSRPKTNTNPLRHPATVALVIALQAKLKEAGLSYREIERLTGVYRNNITRILAGKRSPQCDTIAAIAECIGMELCLRRRKK